MVGRQSHMLALLGLCLLLAPLSSAAAEATGSLYGRVYLPPSSSTNVRALAAASSVVLTSASGPERRAYCYDDGTFEFPALPAGSYLLDVAVMGFMYPQYRVEVPRGGGPAAVSMLANRVPLERPAMLIPLGEAQYYQQRKPFDVKALLFSPYGIMIVVAVFALVVGPSMGVDPEEMKKMQEEMKDSPLGFLVGAKQPPAQAGPGAPKPAIASGGGLSGPRKKKS